MGYDVEVSATERLDPKLPTARVISSLVIVALAVLAIVGAFLPWGTGKVLFISQTVDGFDLDGEITLSLGVAIIVGVVAYLALRFDAILYSLYTLAGGIAILGVIAWQYTKLEDVIIAIGPFTLEITPKVTMEEGMIMTIISGAGITLVSVWQLIAAYRDR